MTAPLAAPKAPEQDAAGPTPAEHASPGRWALAGLCTFVGGGWLWQPRTLPRLPHRARSLLLLMGLVLVVAGLRALSALPELGERPDLPVATPADSAWVGLLRERSAAHPGLSGVRLLVSAEEAFAARLALTGAASRTLDVQVYIWREDLTGTLLLEALHRAAARGVRVRLLVDDNGAQGLDEAFAALDAHPNAEVRLFNPFRFRTHRWFNFVTDFQRLNRRMHNKAFIVDDTVAIVGGRNVGDEYFGPTEGALFIDLDALAVGEVVEDVSQSFEDYWRSEGAWPLERLVEVPEEDVEAWRARRASWRARIDRELNEAPRDPGVAQVVRAPVPALVTGIRQGTLELVWAPVRMISDLPDKALGQHPDNERMLHELVLILRSAKERVELISAYFVPGQTGTERLGELARAGVQLQILTNSLEATDVPAVQAGYAKRRQPLLEAGVRLYELERLGGGEPRQQGTWWSSGSSSSSLHAKTFAVDGQTLFVGSFNFDPRSASLNTELGFVIESPELAVRLGELFAGPVQDRAYEVQLTPEGGLVWIDREGDTVTLHDVEPNSSVWMRMFIGALGVLPIDWLL